MELSRATVIALARAEEQRRAELAERQQARYAQLIAAGCTAASGFALAVGHYVTTTTFDLLSTTVFLWLVVRALARREAWLLLPAGVVVGIGFEAKPPRHWFRFTAFAYGVCAALILDEFALWLNLRDVYWERQGRESVEALAIFSGILLWGVLIAPFAHAVWRHLRGRSLPPQRLRD